MKKSLFIKHDPRIKRALGCDRTTLMLDRLEFYFSRQPDGFYKFIEPNSHKLYKKEDSWTELLGCHRTSFWRAFSLIGKKHSSKWNFEKSKDIFEGKLYACYYDRLTNRMFFIRNKEAVAEFFDKIGIRQESIFNSKEAKENSQPDTKKTQPNESVRTEHNARSYKESNHTSNELFKNNSHASEKIIKKMIDIWISTVQEGKGHVELRSKRVAFLKKAFKDKFDSCLDKWKKYCTDITRSQYLMGEKASTTWKADLDWALKFQSIQNVFDGKYGIGDREPKVATKTFDELQEEINNSAESVEIIQVRSLFLKSMGNATYNSWFKSLKIEIRDSGTLALIAPHNFAAEYLELHYSHRLKAIMEDFPENITNLSIFASEDLKEKTRIERTRQSQDYEISDQDLEEKPVMDQESYEPGIFEDIGACEESTGSVLSEGVTSQTQALRRELHQIFPSNRIPNWLSKVEVETVLPRGGAIVVFEDRITVDWCKNQFSEELFLAVTQLWPHVTCLKIREKQPSRMIYEQETEDHDGRNLFQQAIESLMGASFLRGGQGGSLLNDHICY